LFYWSSFWGSLYVKLLGIPVTATVLINPKTTLTNDTLPQGFERADSFTSNRLKDIEKMSPLALFKHIGAMMTIERVKEIADLLVKNHKPKSFNYLKKYPMKKETFTKKDTPTKPIQADIKETILENPNLINQTNTCLCSKCESPNIEIHYGKYGYYFKCHSCDGNTAIKLTCSSKECKPKLKKSKLNFYQVCEVCGSNKLFFTNAEVQMEKGVV